MTTTSGSIARLASAPEGSGELDDLIWRAQRTPRAALFVQDRLPYTTSISAALVSIPEGCYPTMLTWNSMGGDTGYCAMVIRGPFRKGGWHSDVVGKAKTPALAICVAMMKARGALQALRPAA